MVLWFCGQFLESSALFVIPARKNGCILLENAPFSAYLGAFSGYAKIFCFPMAFPTEVSCRERLLRTGLSPPGKNRAGTADKNFLWKKRRFFMSFPKAVESFPRA